MQSDEPTNRNSIQGQVSGQDSTRYQNPGFRRYGKCCGCTVKGHVLIRGDLPGMRPIMEAFCLATFRMTGQKSAEAIVGDGKRALFREASPRRRAEHRNGEESL